MSSLGKYSGMSSSRLRMDLQWWRLYISWKYSKESKKSTHSHANNYPTTFSMRIIHVCKKKSFQFHGLTQFDRQIDCAQLVAWKYHELFTKVNLTRKEMTTITNGNKAKKIRQCATHYWLIVYCVSSHLIIFYSLRDITIAGEGLQNLGMYSALMAFEQGGILPCHICYDMVPYTVSPEGLSHSTRHGYCGPMSSRNPHDIPTTYSQLIRTISENIDLSLKMN